jgi:hypothetical protein
LRVERVFFAVDGATNCQMGNERPEKPGPFLTWVKGEWLLAPV